MVSKVECLLSLTNNPLSHDGGFYILCHDGVITDLEPDILECEVKWALETITTKLEEVMAFQLSYFKS